MESIAVRIMSVFNQKKKHWKRSLIMRNCMQFVDDDKEIHKKIHINDR